MLRTLITLSLFFIAALSSAVAQTQTSPAPAPAPAKAMSRTSTKIEPRWFKGNLHTHSLWSDGDEFPEMIVEWYIRHRYNFLALSEHDVLAEGDRWIAVNDAKSRAQRDTISRYRQRFGAEWVETRTEGGEPQVRLKPLAEYRTLFERPGHFLLMQGEEITDKLDAKPIHINATNHLEVIKPQSGKNVPEIIANNLALVEEQARRLGRPILAHVNHPNYWYSITAEELAMVKNVRYFEVYNGHPSVNQMGDEEHAGVDRIWDIANTIRIGEMKAPPLSGLASDDSHHFQGQGIFTPGRGWIMVRSRYLTPESMMKAIDSGDFYASTGVGLREVRYSPESKTLDLEIMPHGQAQYKTRFIGTLKGYDPARTPVLDKEGEPLPVTQNYSEDVGKVLATVEGLKPSYQLTGEELYVRAVVTSDQPPENPSYTGQKAQAWTQPVGWEKWMPVAGTVRVATPK
jgi:hypothetical protein